MTQREIVRTAIVLGGVWLVLSGVASLPSIVADFSGSTRHSERDAAEEIRDLFLIYLPSGLLGVLLAAVPGIYAASSADRWAARLVPHEEGEVEIRPSLILAVGAMLMGLSTGISGAIALAASGAGLILQLIDEEASSVLVGMMVERSLYGAFTLLAGVFLFRWGSRAVRRAA